MGIKSGFREVRVSGRKKQKKVPKRPGKIP